MLSVKYDAVLIVVNVRRILESPLAVVDRDRHDPVIFTGRMVDATCVSFVFYAELTFWICACLCIFCGCDCFWIFLWFGQVNGDIDHSVRRVNRPFHIFLYAVTADIIAVLTELVVVFGCLFRGNVIFFFEFTLNLRRSWKQAVHKLCVEEVAVYNTVLDESARNCFIKKVL